MTGQDKNLLISNVCQHSRNDANVASCILHSTLLSLLSLRYIYRLLGMVKYVSANMRVISLVISVGTQMHEC